MTRESTGLEIELTNVDINSGYATYSQWKNKSYIPNTAGEDNLPSHQNTHNHDAATSSNLHSPHRDTSELITLSDASQNSTRIQCYFHHLQDCFIDYFENPVLDGAIIYTGDVQFQYNEQEGM